MSKRHYPFGVGASRNSCEQMTSPAHRSYRSGGTSLFGGRGRPLHALLGGIVIATVFNGLGLTLDSLVRRRGSTPR